MQLEYAPGACNIGPDEIARRRRAAIVGAAATLALGAALLLLGAAPGDPARLAVALPLTGAAIGWIQARRRFCMAYGLVGTFNLGPVGRDGALTRVVDPAALAADRRAALAIGAQGLVIGRVGALLFLFLPVSLG